MTADQPQPLSELLDAVEALLEPLVHGCSMASSETFELAVAIRAAADAVEAERDEQQLLVDTLGDEAEEQRLHACGHTGYVLVAGRWECGICVAVKEAARGALAPLRECDEPVAMLNGMVESIERAAHRSGDVSFKAQGLRALATALRKALGVDQPAAGC